MIYKESLALLTDLYELTMMQGYFFNAPTKEAVFDVFFRKAPFGGAFIVYAGLNPLIEVITNLRFSDSDIEYLSSLGLFKKEFLDYLRDFRFSGDIYSVREGEIVFPNEPVFRIHAKIMEAQLLESIVLNFLNFQSLIATKSARVMLSARGAPILEFGLRRAQGIDGALSASRAAFIGGASATSNTLAGKIYNIPVKGTMAHSWIMSFDDEYTAFKVYSELYPHSTILLVDTYDTINLGLPNAIKIFKELKKAGITNVGIRIDSGDLENLTKEARRILDEEGLDNVKIFVSSELDEWIIDELTKAETPIFAYGVGTKLVTGDKESALSGVYKISAKGYKGALSPCIKISNDPEKITNPGIKNVLRFYKNNEMLADLIYLQEEEEELLSKVKSKEVIMLNHPNVDYSYVKLHKYDEAKVLMKKVVEGGKIISYENNLYEIQRYAKESLEHLPKCYKRLVNPSQYRVSISSNLKKIKQELIKEYIKDIR